MQGKQNGWAYGWAYNSTETRNTQFSQTPNSPLSSPLTIPVQYLPIPPTLSQRSTLHQRLLASSCNLFLLLFRLNSLVHLSRTFSIFRSLSTSLFDYILLVPSHHSSSTSPHLSISQRSLSSHIHPLLFIHPLAFSFSAESTFHSRPLYNALFLPNLITCAHIRPLTLAQRMMLPTQQKCASLRSRAVYSGGGSV